MPIGKPKYGSKNKVGRKSIYDPLEVAKELNLYIETHEDPMIEEFCLMDRSPTKDTLYRLEKTCQLLSDSIKSLHNKQHIRTVKKAEAGEIPTAFAIFKLKQKCYGWTDKQEVEQLNINVEAELSESDADEIIKKFTSK